MATLMSHRSLCVAAMRRLVLLASLLLMPLVAQAVEPRTFDTPEAAVDALIAALKANDEAALVALVGDKHKSLVATGDADYDRAKRAEAAALLQTFHALDDSVADRRVLLIGPQAWPWPIPLVRQGNAWRLAPEQGAEEILNRRI